jgi:hypothetical protein
MDRVRDGRWIAVMNIHTGEQSMPKRSAKRVTKAETAALERDNAETYDKFKEFEGRRYTGMKIGRGHKWYYDQGVWNEKKITPDEWEVNYSVTKRRAGKAPEGTGVPVGTQYHWYIIGHQIVSKLSANDYSTALTGVKFKLAHKRADKGEWSASTKAQRKKAVQLLRQIADELEQQLAEEQKKVAPFKAPKRKSTRKQQPIAA